MADAARQLLGHGPAAGDDGWQIIADASSTKAKFLGAVHQVKHLGRPQHRLGRDAAPVQADAAQVLALNDGDLLAKLAGTDGGNIAAGACADHDHVECRCHLFLPQKTGLALNHFQTPGNKATAAGPCSQRMARTLQPLASA